MSSRTETYLEDGHCSFTNNLSENAMNASAIVYTMVEMAKAHGLG